MISHGINIHPKNPTLTAKVGRIMKEVTGAWYDPLLPYLTKISDGTQPVTAVEDPVGRWIDRSGSNNNAIQATAAARPTYRVDAGGLPYVAWLGTDDRLTCATGGGGSSGFFFCCAVKPTGGAGAYRHFFDDHSAGFGGYIAALDTNNKLVIFAGNGTAWTTKVSTATVNVGTSYVLTVWDDGTRLNVQINNGVVESVARPVVVAGSAGFTIGKDNTAASAFLISDVYHMVYAKNTGLTASQRRTEQLYAASKIGITL